MTNPASTLICTVGTSLFYPNLNGLPKNEAEYGVWLKKQPPEDWEVLPWDIISRMQNFFRNEELIKVAEELALIPSNARICGAEINSVADLEKHGFVLPKPNLFFCYSSTTDGEKTRTVLENYYRKNWLSTTQFKKIQDLQDEDPKRFRTKGLRNLVKEICGIVREYGAKNCAINATGGYKAQIAIAVLIGQALEVPVYYKHEKFSEIIPFPPMPISLDFNLWLDSNDWFSVLDKEECISWSQDLESDWNEKLESLIERSDDVVWLSSAGQIFHETFKDRFATVRSSILPSNLLPAQKNTPDLTSHSWGNARSTILNYLQKLVAEIPYVRTCRTHYWNPDLPSTSRFRLRGDQIEGILSNNSWTVKFFVDTSSSTHVQRTACIADLNSRL